MKKILFAALAMLVMLGSAQAQFSVTITIDERGNGLLTNTAGFDSALPAALQPDPGPGGLAAALTYGLLNPPGLVAGDLRMLETTGGPLSDLIRFNPQQDGGSLVFYSDNNESADGDLADTGFPTAFYTNVLNVVEVGAEGNNGFTYTPTAGQPGFVAGAAGPVTYVIKSDVTVPEPSSVALLATGIAFAGYRVRRYRRRRV